MIPYYIDATLIELGKKDGGSITDLGEYTAIVYNLPSISSTSHRAGHLACNKDDDSFFGFRITDGEVWWMMCFFSGDEQSGVKLVSKDRISEVVLFDIPMQPFFTWCADISCSDEGMTRDALLFTSLIVDEIA